MRIIKKVMIVFIFFCVVLGIFRYYQINKDVPSTYKKEEFRLGDKVMIDSGTLVINKSTLSSSDEKNYLLLDVKLKNTSQKKLNASSIVDNSRLTYDNIVVQGMPKVINGDLYNIKNLEPNSEINFTLRYNITDKVRKKPESSCIFYIANNLITNEIKEKYSKEKVFYYKCIVIKA